jgi:hypothetical protein
LRNEGFSCSLDVLYRGLGINKWQFLIKNVNLFSALNSFPIFGHQNPGTGLNRIRISIQPKMLDPDPESMNPNRKHCCEYGSATWLKPSLAIALIHEEMLQVAEREATLGLSLVRFQ